MKNPSVTIVIPNWNGKELLAKHLPAVIAASGGNEIIVVDDASTDGSVAFIRRSYPGLCLIVHEMQMGYAKSVNTGAEKAGGEIVVLLNTDVRPEKDFLRPLVRHFEDSSVFAVGCLDISYENGNTVYRGRGVAEWNYGFFVHRRGETDVRTTAWVSGGSGAFRKSIWMRLGGMDTLFRPFYWEDIDLSYRALKAGFALRFEKNSRVHHYHQEGKILTNYTPFYIRTVSYRNQCLFIWKNADIRTLFVHFVFLFIRLFQAVVRRDTSMVIGFFWALGKLPYVIVRRIQQNKLRKVRDRDIPLS